MRRSLVVCFSLLAAACGASMSPDAGYHASNGRAFLVGDGSYADALHAALIASGRYDGCGDQPPDVIVLVAADRLSIVDACGKRLTYVANHGTLVLASSTPLAPTPSVYGH